MEGAWVGEEGAWVAASEVVVAAAVRVQGAESEEAEG